MLLVILKKLKMRVEAKEAKSLYALAPNTKGANPLPLNMWGLPSPNNNLLLVG